MASSSLSPTVPLSSTELTATSSSLLTSASTPTNLTASAVSASQIDLLWNGSTGIAGYKIYRGGSLLTSVSASSSVSAGYIDSGLSSSTAYNYTVAAYDSKGNISPQSNQASATTEPAPPPPSTRYAVCDQSVKNVPGNYPTIQAAIDDASVGDTVKVAAGTYNENIRLKSGICLEGAGVDQTIISKSGASGILGIGVSYVIVKNLTVGNSGSVNADGGGVSLSGSTNITLQSCRFTGNIAANGGGVLASESNVTVDHCIIDGNTAHNGGGGIVTESNSAAVLTNVTVVNNAWSNALGNGGVGGVQLYGSGLQIANSIIWGNNQNVAGGSANVSNSDIGGWSGGANNITSNPDFVSATDYHLQAGSPATGMGAY